MSPLCLIGSRHRHRQIHYLCSMIPPVAKRKDRSLALFGATVADPWFWLNEKSNPDVIAHIEAENEYAALVLEATEELQESIFAEIKGRTLETDMAVPAQKGPYWYSTRTQEGESYSIRVRMAGGPDGDVEVVLDENAEAEGHEYFRVGNYTISPDHRFVAYSTDTTGAESYTTRIRDITTQVDLPDALTDCRDGLVWSGDGAYLFYTVADETTRPFQIWRHSVGTEQTADVLVFQEDDERYYLDLSKTRSGDFIVITADSVVTESAWIIPSGSPETDPRPLLDRVEGVQYSIDHRGDVFWIVINDDGADGRLVTVSVNGGDVSEVAHHVQGRKLYAPMCFEQHVVVWGRHDGLSAVFSVDDGLLVPFVFDEAVYTVTPETNLEFSATHVRYSFESLVTPRAIFDQDLSTGERTLLKQTPVLGDFDPAGYVQERHWVPASDGTLIPVSYVRRREAGDERGALLLYAYGAYEISMPATFSIARLSLLDRGVAYAIAHVRGGGEMGKTWYEQGKLEHKANTFSDLVDVAKYFSAAEICDADRIAIRGASAGGLTVGAALNLAPEVFAAVVAEVPFVDVVNTMLDPDLPLTVVEWEEWGNPQVEREYDWISGYSPYENVRRVDYPPILVTAGLNDPRVSYWEPAKWVQRLRERSTSSCEVVLKTEMTAGHFARSGRYDLWRDEATILAFVLTRLGAHPES